LHTCTTKHNLCNSSLPNDGFPGRVIEINPLKCADYIRLIDSSTVPYLKNRYATLSHCWGQVSRTTTTCSNLARMKQGIPIASLSPTFLDAVRVASQLGIKYLWIDSLCIVQDSTEDKNQELPKMISVYANSQLTIAGLSSSNSQESFLRHRKPQLQLNDPVAHLYLQKLANSFIVIPRSEMELRAWIFQEMQLSKRVLYYAIDKMYWRCHTEAGRQETIRMRGQNSGSEVNNRSIIRASNWYHLVEEYSGKLSTYPIDKLPAISAIAQAVQKLTGSTYIAGLWKDDLIHGLLWRRDISGAQTGKLASLKGPGAPSWSWAAYQGVVKSRHRDGEDEVTELATVMDVNIKLLSENYLTGPVSSGTIVLSGPCCEMSFDDATKYDREGGGTTRLDGGNAKLYINLDLAEERESRAPALCLLLKKSKFQLYCLILRPSHVDTKVYRRVGVGEVFYEHKTRSLGWNRRIVTIE
ncbi:heterokaryon incompatibility protein-domain-containing protein, partial [Phaeosphaeriaceae sp. PMI808]